LKPLNPTDFTSVGNKADIRRTIINELGLNYLQVQNFFFSAESPNLPERINAFTDAFPSQAVKLLSISFNGYGPGEVLFYFLCDNATLSGFTSQIDVNVNSRPFAEIKAAKELKPRVFGDFRFGGAFSEANYEFLVGVRNFVNHSENPAIILSELELSQKKINELRQMTSYSDEFSLNLKIVNNDVYANGFRLCNRSDIDFAQKIQIAFTTLSEKSPKTFKEIEDKYFSRVEHILDKTNFLLFNRKNAKCEYFGKLSREMLSIERVTQGRIKPLIKF
jgi:hypothetical protein